MNIIKLIFMQTIGKLTAFLLSKFSFWGYARLRFFVWILASLTIIVSLITFFPLDRYFIFYIGLIVAIILLFQAIDKYRLTKLGKPAFEIESIGATKEEEKKDFSHLQYRNKSWWSFLYFEGKFCLVSLIFFSFFLLGEKVDKTANPLIINTILLLGIWLGIGAPIISKAIKRKKYLSNLWQKESQDDK